MKTRSLKPVLILGAVLALLIGWGMTLFISILGENPGINIRPLNLNFRQQLSLYDDYNVPRLVLDGENPLFIENLLNDLQEKALSVEDHLSVLKRYRTIAFIDRRYIYPYITAAQYALKAHPFSAPLSVIASEAILMGSVSPGENRELLLSYAENLSQSRFSLIELGIRIISGELDSPETALNLEWLPLLLSQDLSSLPEAIRNDLEVNEFLLQAHNRNISPANFTLSSILSRQGSSERSRRMGADFYYDHGNYLRAAELYSQLNNERDQAMAASAYTLAGMGAARNIWLALSGADDTELRLRSIYNLSASGTSINESLNWLERIIALPIAANNLTRTYSLLRFVRLSDPARSMAILDSTEMRQNPLLDLELLRLELHDLPARRGDGEVWLLLERHPQSEALHEWAAWYFDFRRLYSETALVLREATRQGMDGSWIGVHRGLALIVEGRIDEGENIFKEMEVSTADWRVAGNLGRIQESRRNINAALSYYEAAASLVKDNKAAAQIQLRISRCLEALGRIQESRRALQTALEFDPDNLQIHRELRRGL